MSLRITKLVHLKGEKIGRFELTLCLRTMPSILNIEETMKSKKRAYNLDTANRSIDRLLLCSNPLHNLGPLAFDDL